MTEPKPLLTIREIMHLTRYSRRSVINWIQQGRLKALKIGNEWRVRQEDYFEFVEGAEGVLPEEYQDTNPSGD